MSIHSETYMSYLYNEFVKNGCIIVKDVSDSLAGIVDNIVDTTEKKAQNKQKAVKFKQKAEIIKLNKVFNALKTTLGSEKAERLIQEALLEKGTGLSQAQTTALEEQNKQKKYLEDNLNMLLAIVDDYHPSAKFSEFYKVNMDDLQRHFDIQSKNYKNLRGMNYDLQM